MIAEADFGKARRNRRFHFLVQAVLMVSLVIGVNFLATRFFGRTDLGLPERYALSAETKKVLEGLEKPVDIIVTITDSVDPDQPRLRLELRLGGGLAHPLLHRRDAAVHRGLRAREIARLAAFARAG